MRETTHRIVMLGASGAVGQHVVAALCTAPAVARLTLLNRRLLPNQDAPPIDQQIVDVMDASTYRHLLPGHHTAICTLGVGQPSVVSREEFVRVDKDAVIAFGTACKAAGVAHFQLLSSVGAHSRSRSFFLRTKGELRDALEAFGFARLSIFEPSMILTPTNRYGFSQALTLAIWPKLDAVLQGSLRKFRGVPVATLGGAIAGNVFQDSSGVETLRWSDFHRLAG